MQPMTSHDASSVSIGQGVVREDAAENIRSLTILGMSVLNLAWREAFELIETRLLGQGGFTHIAFLNANNANIMVQDAAYRAVLKRSLVLPDGIGVDIAARLQHGRRFSANLNGTDFVPALLSFVESPLRVGLIGATGDVLEKAAQNLQRHAPWHDFSAISDGYFDRDRPDMVLQRLATAEIDLLLVAMGTPLQEKWVDRNLQGGTVKLAMSVGALFDFVSGHVPRAPAWIRMLRLEWLYRLWLEPSRLWRRYVLGIPVFLFHVLRQTRQAPRA